jgi:hypothetical protein
MVIRNQSDKIASGYAQVSRANIKASQNDFEKYIYINTSRKMTSIWIMLFG